MQRNAAQQINSGSPRSIRLSARSRTLNAPYCVMLLRRHSGGRGMKGAEVRGAERGGRRSAAQGHVGAFGEKGAGGNGLPTLPALGGCTPKGMTFLEV